MCINEPKFQKTEEGLFGQILIDFEVEINQSEEKVCKIQLSLEGAFLSESHIEEEQFKKMVVVNGAAALIGIARGKADRQVSIGIRGDILPKGYRCQEYTFGGVFCA